ncbi:hypothetical protein F2Q69_00005752 [Brassica cretica]|uniref:Uncharacterized protein n=1 Tax=Brassica cretica TaxID=69181 RepID=A0A8S9PA10_BRACR|nr:hypothetical protein F2Q69_00005752 [Brassica cretica]
MSFSTASQIRLGRSLPSLKSPPPLLMKVDKAEEPDGGGCSRSGGSLAAGRCSWFIDDEEI